VYRTTGGNNGAYLTRANGIGSLPDGIVPLGQAFFARATSATTFTFANAMRVEANPATVARPSAETRPVLGLTLTDAQGQGDETFVYAEAGATAEADARFDGLKPGRNVGVPTLATLIGTEEAAINGLPETLLTQPATVELIAVLPTVGTYTLAVGQFVNFGSTTVELLDRLTGTRYDLRTTPVVTLTATRANEEMTGRFALVFNGQRITSTADLSPLTSDLLSLFPNPATGGTEVRVVGVAAGEVVRLLDATGRVVRVTTTAVLNTRELATGVYTVRTTGGRTTRLVVE
jgi:hypothetical protein